MSNLYCYVDENGLETEGQLFIVAVVAITDPEKATIICEELEQMSGKGKNKWRRTKHSLRMDYLQRAFASTDLYGRICYVVFRRTQDYEASTVEAVSRTVRHLAAGQGLRASVYVDALSKTKRQTYGSLLRKSGINVHKVQGVTKDENNALIRLADATAGFVRDAIDGDSEEIKALLKMAEDTGALIQV